MLVTFLVTLVGNYYFVSLPYKETDEVAVERRLSDYTYMTSLYVTVIQMLQI